MAKQTTERVVFLLLVCLVTSLGTTTELFLISAVCVPGVVTIIDDTRLTWSCLLSVCGVAASSVYTCGKTTKEINCWPKKNSA